MLELDDGKLMSSFLAENASIPASNYKVDTAMQYNALTNRRSTMNHSGIFHQGDNKLLKKNEPMDKINFMRHNSV